MKLFVSLILLLSISLTVYAKKEKEVDMKQFSKKLNENITKRVDQNPQSYETVPIMRGPASSGPVEIIPDADPANLDKFQEQAVGHDNY